MFKLPHNSTHLTYYQSNAQNSSSQASVQFSSVIQSCLTLCDPMDCSMPGFILLLFVWSNRCWQFDLWFLCFSKSSLNIWSSQFILLKPSLENFEHYFASVWDECNCAVVWTFFGIAFLWDWKENWPFPVLWPIMSFTYLLAIECSTFTASSFRI